MTGPFANQTDRSNRILAEKLRLLYRGNFAVPANFVISCVIAFILRDSFPHAVLALWLGLTAIVVGLRLLLYRRFLKAAAVAPCSVCWARAFCVGALASGLLWGGLSLGLLRWGSGTDYVVMTLVISGVSAGALTTIVTYLPAFFSYAGAMILPLAASLLMYHDPSIAATGWLMILFMFVVGFAARNLSRSATESIELHVDNDALNRSLKQAQAERDAARTEKWSTLAQLSHELRTPLNAVIGFSEAMREEFFGPLGSPRYKNYAENVHGSGLHLLTLVDQILEFSNSESGKLELKETSVNLGAVVASVFDATMPAAQERELHLREAVQPGLPPVRADAAKLRQILLTLARNAITFTPAGGEVRMAALRNAAGGVDLTVQDTGIGMGPEEIEVALTPFGRGASPLKNEGSGIGLGLPLCKRLAELHGAEFTLESEPGEGTVCTVSFPAWRCAAGEPTPASVAAA